MYLDRDAVFFIEFFGLESAKRNAFENNCDMLSIF